MLVDFEIINRSARASFIVGNVAVYVQGKPADADYVLKGGTSSAEIPFAKSGVLGTAWWTATETTVFDLLVEEHGGQGRKVWVRNLTF
jgi:hypothetical protein